MAEPVRQILLRYVNTRPAVLRPKSVESLVNDLLPFADYRTAHHPQITCLRELERTHIEDYLAWNRTRGWRAASRGQRRPTISKAVAHSSVLSLRNILDDITAWDWDQAPHTGSSSPPTSPSLTSPCRGRYRLISTPN
ncbi:hypothetical protein B2J88_45235 [Rhodococcus sp. SRB_17]|nr:hypothetical protein [Rhodococcus sp. SRB_17]